MKKYFPDISHTSDFPDTKILPMGLVLTLPFPLQLWLGQMGLEKHLYLMLFMEHLRENLPDSIGLVLKSTR